MRFFRQWLLFSALCGGCCSLAVGQETPPTGWDAHPAIRPELPRLARLPTLTPPGMPGSASVFAGWQRGDVRLAPDRADNSDWGSGQGKRLPPWRLLPRARNGWSFTGLINIGSTANRDQPASRFNGPLLFNDRTDGQLNQLYLSVQRTAPAGKQQGRFQWGSRIDFLFGTDYVFVQSAGLETQPDGDNALNGLTSGNRNPDLYGLAIPQAFADVSYDRFNLRLGRFYTLVGYEGVAASSNFFYSHSYALQYGEPLTHTGGLLSWTGPWMTLQAGLVNGWDKTDGVNDDATFLGGLSFASETSSLGISVISGNEDSTAGTSQRTMYSLVWQHAITPRLAYVLQHDLSLQRDAVAAGVDAQWYGISQYLFCALSDAWKLGVRYEWFHDDRGTRLSRMYARNGGLGLPAAGFAGNYHNATVGANWTPNANLTLRPEIRWDWSSGNSLAPFDDFTSDSQLTFAVDAIYIF